MGKIRKFLSRQSDKFPIGIGVTMFVNMIFYAMVSTVLFSFLPKMVKFFGVSEVDTGYKAGVIATSFYIGQFVFSMVWGHITDSMEMKYALILCGFCLSGTTIFFGLSRTFSWAFIARFLQGSSMGHLIIFKALITNICEERHMAFGLSIMMSAFTVGSIVGPSIGGFLAFPEDQYPKMFSHGNLFAKYGILLPNLVLVMGVALGMLLVLIYIPKSKKVHSNISDPPKPINDSKVKHKEAPNNGNEAEGCVSYDNHGVYIETKKSTDRSTSNSNGHIVLNTHNSVDSDPTDKEEVEHPINVAFSNNVTSTDGKESSIEFKSSDRKETSGVDINDISSSDPNNENISQTDEKDISISFVDSSEENKTCSNDTSIFTLNREENMNNTKNENDSSVVTAHHGEISSSFEQYSEPIINDTSISLSNVEEICVSDTPLTLPSNEKKTVNCGTDTHLHEGESSPLTLSKVELKGGNNDELPLSNETILPENEVTLTYTASTIDKINTLNDNNDTLCSDGLGDKKISTAKTSEVFSTALDISEITPDKIVVLPTSINTDKVTDIHTLENDTKFHNNTEYTESSVLQNSPYEIVNNTNTGTHINRNLPMKYESTEDNTNDEKRYSQGKANFFNKLKKSKLSQVFQTKDALLSGFLYMNFAMIDIGYNEILPVLTSTSTAYRGMNLSPSQLGTVLLIAPTCYFIPQITVGPKLIARYGPKSSFIVLNLILTLCYAILPIMSAVHYITTLYVCLIVVIIIIRVSVFGCMVAVNILVNNSVRPDLLGTINGAVLSAVALGRLIAPMLFGSIYSWSLTNIVGVRGNKHPLGFPCNQFMTFYVLALLSVVIAALTTFLPESINNKKVE